MTSQHHLPAFPTSENMPIPAATPSDGAIRVLVPRDAHVVEAEEASSRRPMRARLVVALLLLAVGGATVWLQYEAEGEPRAASHP